MGEWDKTYTQLVDEQHLRSHTEPERPWPAAKKYKSSRYEGDDNLDDKEIGVGTRVIVRVTGVSQSVLGYMLGTVIDTEDESTFWSARTIFIIEVNEVSNPKLNHHLNRLRCASGERDIFSRGHKIVEVGKANWSKYIPSGR
jgi:hypothetical protein